MQRLHDRYLLLLVLFFLGLSSCKKAIVFQSSSELPKRARLIIDRDKKLSPPLIELMQLTNLPITDNLAAAVMTTQKSWLRRAGDERSDILEKKLAKVKLIKEKSDSLGLVQEVRPEHKAYDYFLILGSMYESFVSRLSFVEDLIKNGYTVKTIVLLGSERPLDQQRELVALERRGFKKMPATELEMMRAVYAASQTIKKFAPQVLYVNSPMKRDSQGKLLRANTRDTVVDFHKLNVPVGSALVISSQPYVLRQDLVVRGVLQAPWRIETVGPKAAELVSGVFLDELARTLYELQGFLEHKN